MNSNILKKRIMRRVYVIYTLRQALSPLALKVYVLAVSFVGIASLVSVGNVFANMPADLLGMFTFVFYALTHTEFVVQLLIFGTLAVALWLVRDLAKGFHLTPHLSRV